jgi:hypothetical protein
MNPGRTAALDQAISASQELIMTAAGIVATLRAAGVSREQTVMACCEYYLEALTETTGRTASEDAKVMAGMLATATVMLAERDEPDA